MPMITPVGFQTALNDKLLIGTNDLPISASAASQLTTLLGADGYIFLTVQDQVGVEIIKVSGGCGAFVVARAQDATTQLNFPKGSCVAFRITPAIIKDMVCNTECCGVDCCVPVTLAGGALPAGVVGMPYSQTIVFSGSLPIQIGVSPLPAWLTATVGGNFVKFTGTPPTPQTISVGTAATNCNGAVVSTSAAVNFV